MREKKLMGFLVPEWAEQDPMHNCFPAGQGCGAIHEVQSCRQIVDEIVAGAEAILRRGILKSGVGG